ncbi:MAG: hypothetical protein E6J56_04235 [Deltaproteobacteria bacterium]|nr:MAG: hypothetical protein E6J56_04235 [Deltaproteobacteria bacterium]
MLPHAPSLDHPHHVVTRLQGHEIFEARAAPEAGGEEREERRLLQGCLQEVAGLLSGHRLDLLGA